MNEALLQLVGGPLCGLFLPVTPEAETPPRQLIVYSPWTRTWTSYVDRQCKRGPVDVYKIRMGAKLSTMRPRHVKIVDLFYVGCLTPAAVQFIEEAERERRETQE